MPLRHHGRLGTCQPGSGDMGTPCLAAQHGLSVSPAVWGQDWVAVPGLPWGPPAQGWHLHPAQPWPQEVLRGHGLSPELQPKPWGHPRGVARPLTPCDRLHLPRDPREPGWVLGAPRAVLRLCHCSQVLDSEVWEQVSAVSPCQAGLGWGEGQDAQQSCPVLRRGSATRLAPSHTCPRARGCSEGGCP